MLRSPCALNVTQESNLTHTVTYRRVELYKNEKSDFFLKLLLFVGPSRLPQSKSEGNFE